MENKSESAPPLYDYFGFNNDFNKDQQIISLNRQLIEEKDKIINISSQLQNEKNKNSILNDKLTKNKKPSCCLQFYYDTKFVSPIIFIIMLIIGLIVLIVVFIVSTVPKTSFHTFEGNIGYEYIGKYSGVFFNYNKYKLSYLWNNNGTMQSCFQVFLRKPYKEDFEYTGITGPAYINVQFNSDDYVFSGDNKGQCFEGTSGTSYINSTCI